MTEAAIPTKSSLSPGTYRADQAKVLSRWSETRADVDMFGMIAAFCAAGLLIATLLVACGFDLAAEFF
jgi:hypothetical protein